MYIHPPPILYKLEFFVAKDRFTATSRYCVLPFVQSRGYAYLCSCGQSASRCVPSLRTPAPTHSSTGHNAKNSSRLANATNQQKSGKICAALYNCVRLSLPCPIVEGDGAIPGAACERPQRRQERQYHVPDEPHHEARPVHQHQRAPVSPVAVQAPLRGPTDKATSARRQLEHAARGNHVNRLPLYRSNIMHLHHNHSNKSGGLLCHMHSWNVLACVWGKRRVRFE